MKKTWNHYSFLLVRLCYHKSKCKSVCRWSPFFGHYHHVASRSGKRRGRSEINGRYKRCVGRLHLERSEILCNGVKQPKLNKKRLRSPLYAQTQPNPKAVTETYSATAFRLCIILCAEKEIIFRFCLLCIVRYVWSNGSARACPRWSDLFP